MAVRTASKALDLYLSTDHLVGQERARRQLAVLLERQVRVAAGDHQDAAGAILAGPTGSGKTAMARAMCEASGLAFAETNATRYTEAGYAGLDLQQMFLTLLESAGRLYDRRRQSGPYQHSPATREPSVLKRPDIREIVKVAETGVVLLDEFDKWMLRVNHVTGQQDKAIQADLLKLVEGSIEYVSSEELKIGIPFDSSRVLIICAGAFIKLTRTVAARLGSDATETSETFWDHIEPLDFERAGMIPELAGRLSTHIFTRALTKDELTAILMQPDSLLNEYRRRFQAIGCEWDVPQDAVLHLADQAIRSQTGARGIAFACWKAFSEALYYASVAERSVRVSLRANEPRARIV